MEGMNLRKLLRMEHQLSPLEYIKWLQECGLLADKYVCSKCVCEMVLGVKSESSDGYVWRCFKCKTSRSVRCGSWFAKSKLSLKNIVLFTYMWVHKFSHVQVMRETGMSSRTVVDWYNFCREVCCTLIDSLEVEQIGGVGKVVEIDESLFCKRKYNKGKKKKSQQWVFGGVEQGSNKCFLMKVNKRDAATLVPLIKKHVAPGTTIYSDCWKAYDCLGRQGYKHLKVNHSVTFKDGDCCTNTVEGMWGHVKRMFPKCNRQKGLFDTYLGEFMFRRRYDCDDLFPVFMQKIAQVYVPLTSDEDVNNN